jgi:hypothetical protein
VDEIAQCAATVALAAEPKIDYTLDRIAFVERELAEIKDRMRQFEASRPEPPDVPLMLRPAE